MEKSVIQVNGGITINVNVSVKNNMHVKKIMFEILLHVAVKMENIKQVSWMMQQFYVMKLKSHKMKKHQL